MHIDIYYYKIKIKIKIKLLFYIRLFYVIVAALRPALQGRVNAVPITCRAFEDEAISDERLKMKPSHVLMIVLITLIEEQWKES